MRRLLRALALYGFHICIVRPVLRGLVGVRYTRRTLPAGACLVVSNHNSHLDAAVLMTLFPLRRLPRVHPVAAADYFGRSWWRSAVALLLMNGIAIDRKAARANGQDTLEPLVDALRAGDSLIFFPEGSRGEAGVVAPFRPGIGVLARSVPDVPVVPVFLSGPERIWPRGRLVPVPLSIDVNVGKPRLYSPERTARAIAEQVRDDVLMLAPTPPPLPRPRANPAVRVAICGAENAARGEIFRRVVARLARLGPTVELPEQPGEEREAQFFVQVGHVVVDWLASAGADAEQARVIQYLAGKKLLPPASWWRFVRRAPGVGLFNVLGIAKMEVPAVLVLVRPQGALQESYARAGALLRKRSKIDVIEVDPAAIEEAALAVETVCRRLLAPVRAAKA